MDAATLLVDQEADRHAVSPEARLGPCRIADRVRGDLDDGGRPTRRTRDVERVGGAEDLDPARHVGRCARAPHRATAADLPVPHDLHVGRVEQDELRRRRGERVVTRPQEDVELAAREGESLEARGTGHLGEAGVARQVVGLQPQVVELDAVGLDGSHAVLDRVLVDHDDSAVLLVGRGRVEPDVDRSRLGIDGEGDRAPARLEVDEIPLVGGQHDAGDDLEGGEVAHDHPDSPTERSGLAVVVLDRVELVDAARALADDRKPAGGVVSRS